MKVLMVCLGNICRSPLAHGVLQKEIDNQSLNWSVDSSGTSSFHSGDLPDSRSIEVARENGIDITNQRSRLFVKNDFNDFDLILAMDSSNYQNILKLASSDEDRSKVKLLLNYAYPGENRAVPDPYYEGGFQSVYNMIETAVSKLVETYK
jgi:protein-tyrosine phosphatase